jgi:hypothetical protein
MFKRFAALVVALVVLPFAACGSKAHPKPHAPKVIDGHKCMPHDEALQCVLPPAPKPTPPPSPSTPPVQKVGAVSVQLAGFTQPTVVQGLDFAWGAPTVGRIRAFGARFGASYLSYDGSKGWTQRSGLVSEYHRAGIATVAVWETSADRAGQGCGAGTSDAREASRQALALGNANRPINFAIDFEAEGSQVDSYFRCAHAILGDRTSAYGSYYAVKYLCAHGLVGHTNWQTYAWSGGQWLPASCAPLEQYYNDSSVDYDRALASDYGQWPGPAAVAVASRAQKQLALYHLYRVRNSERAEILHFRGLLRRYRCYPPHRPQRGGRCEHWKRAGDVAHRAGDVTNRQIKHLHSEGV